MSFPKKETTEKYFSVWVPWNQPMPWNEICSKVIEVFGLPGDRFNYHSTDYFMRFQFKSKKDFILCEILLSEYIIR